MSSFLSRAASNTHVQLATTAIVSGAVVATAILGYQKAQLESRISRLKSSIPDIDGENDDLRKVRRASPIPRPRGPMFFPALLTPKS
jgi:tRNA threonylcarbamoyladenosine dehydratase